MKTYPIKLTVASCLVIALASCFFGRRMAPRDSKDSSELSTGYPIKADLTHKDKRQTTAGELFLSEIKPINNINNFNDAFSESVFIIKSYESSRRANGLVKSEYIKYRNDLAKAYAILLSLKMNENGDGAEVILREINNCGTLIKELIDQQPFKR